MATGIIKNTEPQFLIERVTIVSGGTSSTYYATFSANVEKNGYTPIAVGSPSFNQAGIFAYNTFFDGLKLTLGALKFLNLALCHP